nr:EamA family transporter [Campylobacter iguaniorum]
MLIVCLGAFSFAFFSVLSKKVAINPQNAVAIYFFSAIIYSFFSVLFFSEFRLLSAREWGFILINGIFLNGISYLFWIKALRELDASFAALLFAFKAKFEITIDSWLCFFTISFVCLLFYKLLFDFY